MNRKGIAAIIAVLGMVGVLAWQSAAFAQTPEPPAMISTLGIFTPPPTVFPPAQADQGAQVYFYICMVCHGDKGQGLAEWRKKLDPPDNNCFQSKCHAPNFMPGGFTFPHEVPAVVGAGLLDKFTNAQQLHDYIKRTMPWYAPGDLKDEEYWQLTAFLMRENGRDPGSATLTAANAPRFVFAKPFPSASPPPWLYAAIGGAAVVGIGVALALVMRRRMR